MTNSYSKLLVLCGLLVFLPTTLLSCPFLVAINGGCLTDAECAGENKVCNKWTGECHFECENDDDCSGDVLCVDKHCFDNPCADHGQYDADSGTCTYESAYCGGDCSQSLCLAYNDQLIKDGAHALTWTRCPFRKNETIGIPTPDCHETGQFASFSYCTDFGNSCNGGIDNGELAESYSEVWAACHDLDFADHTDWRVPTSAELRNLANNQFKDRVFENLGSENFLWSSTSSSRDYAIAVRLKTAEQGAILKYSRNILRCVRGL